MRVLLLLRGSAGCGKSTWIKNNRLSDYTLSADDLRMLCASPSMRINGGYAIDPSNDGVVWKTLFNILETRMKNGEFTVIDATNSKTSEMNRYKKLCDDYRYRIYCVDFTDIPIEVTKQRNRNRHVLKQVPEEVIDKMYARFETQKIPSGIKVIKPDELNSIWLKKINFDKYKKIHHIGDIHGCSTVLMDYFRMYPMKDDELYIFCGDYIDRGIENDKVMEFLLSIYENTNVILLEGNHERWLWKWANNEKTPSREFELFTRTQLEQAAFNKKDIRKLYRRLIQCAYYEYRGKTFLITHGGLSFIPDNITTVATKQMIHGVGDYKSVKIVDDTFSNIMGEKFYQIHGHRNVDGLPVRINDSAFNLEGNVEFGGCLRVVSVDENGLFKSHEMKNSVFKSKESNALEDSSIGDLVLAMRDNKYITEKQFGNISSFNFSSKAFYEKVWNAQTMKARGLYINIPKEKIVARAYDKFFNINEREETKLDVLQCTLKFPVKTYVKENGYLGIVSYNPDTDDLFITTKSNPEGNFAMWLRQALYNNLSKEDLKRMISICKDKNVSFVFENVDMVNDPHIIEYEKSELFLLDIIHNDLNFKKYDYGTLQLVAKQLHLKCKEFAYEFDNWNDFYNWYEEVNKEEYKYNGRIIEGFVLEDASGYMTKMKLAYYNFWKFMRTISSITLKHGYINPDKTSALTTPIANKYYAWIKTLYKQENVPTDICSLRKMFLESEYGKEFK